MDVLNRKALPLVGIGSLVLGGACGDGLSTTKIAQNFCSFQLECEGEYFTYEYGSFDECVSEETAGLEESIDYYTEYYGADCGNAVLAYYRCIGRFYANAVCGAEPAYPNEYATFASLCEF